MIILYRPLPNSKHELVRTPFASEFTASLKIISTDPGKLLIIGDFNIHRDNENPTEINEFIAILYSHNLQQHVTQGAHLGLGDIKTDRWSCEELPCGFQNN